MKEAGHSHAARGEPHGYSATYRLLTNVTKISFQIAETFLKQPLMALLIVELPHDILISIFLHLSIESVLSLKQASHIFTSPGTDTLNMHGLTRRRVVVYMLSAPQTTSGTD